jgi:hypothetical protein
LIEGSAKGGCHACIVMPARNEAAHLNAALDALADSVDLRGRLLPANSFEILLLLNNCTDDSLHVAVRWQLAHPAVALHVIERALPAHIAHVGTARRLLMDTAWLRLRGRAGTVILSTDADTSVTRDWIAQNLLAVRQGAHAVGGAIHFAEGELESLPQGARDAFRRDARYQSLMAELEHWLDPQAGDPWPRHLQHFGASLACTPEMYARSGGMPAIDSLEDVAFVDALRRIDARLRHAPPVVVYSSARMDGRAGMGLSNQLRQWQRMSDGSVEHSVLSCAWLTHRFRALRHLREFCRAHEFSAVFPCPPEWRARLREVHHERLPVGRFLAEIDCDRLMEESFRGARYGEIGQVCREIPVALGMLKMTGTFHRDIAASRDFALAEAGSGD